MIKLSHFLITATGLTLLLAGCSSGSNGLYKDDFQDVIREAKEQVFPAVVYIHTIRGNLESGKNIVNTISGSGVVITPDGEVITNYHVVEKALEVRCLLNTGKAYNAKVIGGDKDIDLALLKLDVKPGDPPLTCAELEKTKPVEEGDFVMAMGAPWGMNRSVSIGIISCSKRYLNGSSQYTLWLQTDATICPGNSGGPLINTEGKIIGLNTFGIMGDIGFALPATTIAEALPQLRQHGRINWGWCGLELQPLNDFDRNIHFNYTEGVMVAGTANGSLARKAGLLPNDRIVAINNRQIAVKTNEELPEFQRFLALLPHEESVQLKIFRNGKEITIPLSLRDKGTVEGAEVACPRWGLTAKTINRFETPTLHMHLNNGLYVYGIAYPGNAARADLRREDIILSIDGKKIETLEDMKKVYDEVMERQNSSTTVVMMIQRNGSYKQIVLDFSTDYDKE